MNDTISVIIPTYNRKELLKETLKTLFSQSIPAHEIIVVDNQSTDGTYEWLKEQKDKVITVQNKGVNSPGAARNLGMHISTGRYVKYFDSDDLMTSNTLDAQLEVLKNTGKGFVYSPYFYAREISAGEWESKDSVILNYFPFGKKPLYHYMMVYGLFITIPGMLFKRELLKEAGTWREDMVSSEDWDYLFRLSLIEPFPAHTNECAFLYRLHGQQTTESNYNSFERDVQKKKMLIDLYNKSIRNNGRFSAYKN